jgi:hypothetical protein
MAEDVGCLCHAAVEDVVHVGLVCVCHGYDNL